MKSLLVVYSYYHNNTRKVADVFARVLDAKIKAPQRVNPEGLQQYDLVGFSSGIYSEVHHTSLLDLADSLPRVVDRNAFIFSTSAIQGEANAAKDHSLLREKLQRLQHEWLPQTVRGDEQGQT